MPGVNIQAPSLKPPRVSILSSADVITISGDKWWSGINYKRLSGNPALGDPVLGVESDPDAVFILPICPVDSTEKVQWPRGENDSAIPFAVYATESCSGFGISASEIIDRAKQKLAVNEAWSIEHELWFGTATTNRSLADANVDLGTGFSPVVGFATIDAAVAQDRTDGRGMVYMTTRTFDLLQQYHLFRREGNVWFSPLDNIVVPMRGVPQDTATEWKIYGHPGILQIVHSDVFSFPDDAREIETAMNRATNDLQVVAERVVSYIIPAENIYEIEVDESLGGPSGGGSGGGGDASAANQLLAIAELQGLDLNTDQIEALLTALGSNTDAVEAKLDTLIASFANVEDTLTADSATLSNVTSSATNVTVAAANANRRGLMIHNDSTAILYVKFGATASTSSFSVKIPADTYWEMSMPIYQGQVDGIWASANGNARVTELT